ncbi:hypothetical protein KIS4809_3608 [Bacillus sp. ZZV12-4809]|nr:hypothetical protein KIS4809_3608 [Bacillus sp. ZZV12-4809]
MAASNYVIGEMVMLREFFIAVCARINPDRSFTLLDGGDQ